MIFPTLNGLCLRTWMPSISISLDSIMLASTGVRALISMVSKFIHLGVAQTLIESPLVNPTKSISLPRQLELVIWQHQHICVICTLWSRSWNQVVYLYNNYIVLYLFAYLDMLIHKHFKKEKIRRRKMNKFFHKLNLCIKLILISEEVHFIYFFLIFFS